MKILQINSVCGIGSTGRIATDIHNILIEQGHESYIAYGRDLPKNCDNAIRIGTKIDNYTHVAKTRLFDKHGFGSTKATEEFINKVKDIDPDIIHLHNIHGYYINIEILFDYLKEADKPVVWTLHDCWSFTGHCSHFDYISCDKWKTGCFECPQKKEYPQSFLIDNSRWNYNKKKEVFAGVNNMTIVTPSHWLAETVKRSYLNEYKIKVIHNGIDRELFKPTNCEFRKINNLEDKYIILGVANVWTERKGLYHFIQLANRLKEDEIIILVGLSDKQKKKLPSNIIGVSKTNSIEELSCIYSSADVYLNLTLEEVLGMTNIEALACGTPVITFRSGGSPECIDENSGRVINGYEISSVLKEIRKMQINKLETKNCLSRAELFSKEEKLIRYLKTYNDIFNIHPNNYIEDGTS